MSISARIGNMDTKVISLGGSIIVPDDVDYDFLGKFRSAVVSYLEEDEQRRLILVTGGGSTARKYQNAAKKANAAISDSQLDWIGIRTTHLNATLLKGIFGPLCKSDIVLDMEADIDFQGRVLIAGGWKPGFSTDTDSVYLARRFSSSIILNLSNIKKVYTDDPRYNPEAKPIDRITWDDFQKMVGTEWVPGKNTPFDPIASRLAKESKMSVFCIDGRNIENTLAALRGEEFEGTIISPS